MSILSPLTRTKDITLLDTLKCKTLIRAWQSVFSINITNELNGSEIIELYECNQTKLRFFVPISTSGSGELYTKLAKFDWYYMPRKWEHNVALLDIEDENRILEVGCGYGAFVKRVCEEKRAKVLGIELNRSAVLAAQAEGLPVQFKSLEAIANSEYQTFDVVCHFEVLEHVSNPLLFLNDCVRCLKVGGRLLIAVPNMNSFIRMDRNNLLNQPPHHMTQWQPVTFHALQNLLPLKLIRISYEPLASYHINWYLSVQAQQLPNIKYIKGLSTQFLYRFIQPLLHGGLCQFVRGHTQYIVFEKIA